MFCCCVLLCDFDNVLVFHACFYLVIDLKIKVLVLMFCNAIL